MMGTIVFISAEQDCNNNLSFDRQPGKLSTVCQIPGDIWMPGCYSVTVGIQQENICVLDEVGDVIQFEVAPINSPGADGRRGVISPILHWETWEMHQ